MLQESRLALPEAYILLNCDTGEEGDVIKELRAISGVFDVKVVFGIYDIIATLSADADEDIKKSVAKIRMIGGSREDIRQIYNVWVDLVDQTLSGLLSV